MRVFVDEDTGSSIGIALKAVGVNVEYVDKSKHSLVRCGTKDEVWLPIVGNLGMLVLSRNTGILEVETERELVVAHNIGIVFFPQGLPKLELLRLILKKWEWLLSVDTTETRPFAFFVNSYGRHKRLSVAGPIPRRRRKASPTKTAETLVAVET